MRAHPVGPMLLVIILALGVAEIGDAIMACSAPVPKAVDCRVEFAARAADAGCVCARDAGGE
jgi:hypothetical protein